MAELNIQEHFKVPEGYFDNLAEQVMNSLPEQSFQPMHIKPADTVKQTKVHRFMPMWTRYAAAACIACVVIVSAFMAFNTSADKGVGNSEPVAQVTTTTVVDTFKQAVETIAPANTAKETPVLAKVEKTVVHKATTVHPEPTTVRSEKTTLKKSATSHRQSYDIDVNSGYDQNEMERAAMYMGIDHQTMCEMMYEDL